MLFILAAEVSGTPESCDQGQCLTCLPLTPVLPQSPSDLTPTLSLFALGKNKVLAPFIRRKKALLI